MSELSLLYSTYPDTETARSIARRLLEERLVACCNILPPAESHYWWKGELTACAETVMLCKVAATEAETALSRIAQLHPYECPAILVLSAEADDAFAAWLSAQTALPAK